MTHDAAARAVAEGAADVALGILPAATARGLDFSRLSRSATTSSPHASTTRATCSRRYWVC